MRKWRSSMIVAMVVVMMFMGMSSALASPEDQTSQSSSKVVLTDIQKQELAALHKHIMDKKRELINRYVQFGVIPEEKGKMIIARFEEHYKKLEQNGFIPNCKKRDKMQRSNQKED